MNPWKSVLFFCGNFQANLSNEFIFLADALKLTAEFCILTKAHNFFNIFNYTQVLNSGIEGA